MALGWANGLGVGRPVKSRVIRFPIADPLQTAVVAATELDRDQLEQLRDQVTALLVAGPRHTATVRRRVIRFPIADPFETAVVAASELDRDQLEQLRDQVTALVVASLPQHAAPGVKPRSARAPMLADLPVGPQGGGCIEWKKIRRGDKVFGPYPYLRVRVGGRQRSIYLKALAQATRESATSAGHVSPSA